jgi:hypothetical protein
MLNNRKKMGNISNFDSILAASAFTIIGLLINIVPSQAFSDNDSGVSDTYRANDYRVCAARLLKAGVAPSRIAETCPAVIRPSEFSNCVGAIRKRTQLPAEDTVNACRKSRRPEDLATCVVSISKHTNQADDPAVLASCSRSLLPISFGQCVVGLPREINLTPAQSLDSCNGTGDRASGISSGSTITPSQY